MDDILGFIPSHRRTPDDAFVTGGEATRHSVGAFWAWAHSDLLANTQRAIVAEYIVGIALGDVATTRPEWRGWDLELPEAGRDRPIRVEIKATAPIQSWAQPRLSPRRFDFAPKGAWDETDGSFDETKRRRSDVYVFCVLGGDDAVPDPLNLDQWVFYVLPTRVLDERMPAQQSITLTSLLRLEPKRVQYGGLRTEVGHAAGGPS